MKYVGIIKENVIVAKAKIYKNFVDERHIELTEEQYNQLITPCEIIDGKFVPCEYPTTQTPEAEPSAEDDIDSMLIDHEYRLTILELGVN